MNAPYQHSHGPMSQQQRAVWQAFVGLPAILVGLWGLATVIQQPIPPLGADAPADQFSEARARPIVRTLADEIGSHPVGSAAGLAAADYLTGELRKLPRLQVEQQDVEGDTRLNIWPDVNFHYRVRNVIARLPGTKRDAILINSHYDSPVEAHGGSDNGTGTAAAVEAMRALAASPPLTWSVILVLNGGEEAGSGGAAGFLKHPLAKDVRAFIDLDGSCRGKANLMQASPQVPALLHAYARAVRFPQATVFGTDFVQSGLTQASGDFEPLTRAGLPGLDVAAVKDTWGVHTHLDRSSRLQPGTLQDLGAVILGVTTELAQKAPDLTPTSDKTVYYDLLGQTTLVYSMRTASRLAIGALLLLVGVLVLVIRRGELTLRSLLRSSGWTLLAALGGLLGTLVPAVALAVVLGRGHGFYATPWLIVPSFAVSGLCGVLLMHLLWRKRALASGLSAESSALSVWAGGLLLFGVTLALCTAGSLGLAYLPLWWLVPGTAALGLGSWLKAARWWLWLGSVAIGAASFIHLAVGLIPATIGLMVGMNPGPPPGDLVMAMLLFLLVILPLSLGGIAGVHCAGRLKQAVAVCSAIAVLGSVASALRFPYTEARPKRVTAIHTTKAGQTALVLMSEDYLPLAPALGGLREAVAITPEEEWPHITPPGWMPPFTHKLPAEPTTIPPPRVEILARTENPQRGTRTVRVRLVASGWMTMLTLPREALAGWSMLEPLPTPIAGQRMISVMVVAPSPTGQEFSFELRGSAPVEVTIKQFHPPDQAKELLDLRARLPSWTTINARTLKVESVQL